MRLKQKRVRYANLTNTLACFPSNLRPNLQTETNRWLRVEQKIAFFLPAKR